MSWLTLWSCGAVAWFVVSAMNDAHHNDPEMFWTSLGRSAVWPATLLYIGIFKVAGR